MSTESHQITVNGLPVHVVRKEIRNLHMGVYPPNGRVRVAVPLHVNDDAVRLAVIRRLGWIRKRRAEFAAQPRQTEREMVSGESHYYLGRRYRLRVVKSAGPSRVLLRNRTTLELQVPPEYDSRQREEVLWRWYRQRLRQLVPPLLAKWEAALRVDAATWGIKRMKTKWGSCTVSARRIWVNLDLAKKPVQCLEYIVVHELMHLIEPHHNERFVSLLDRHLPQWRHHQVTLNEEPLGHSDWTA